MILFCRVFIGIISKLVNLKFFYRLLMSDDVNLRRLPFLLLMEENLLMSDYENKPLDEISSQNGPVAQEESHFPFSSWSQKSIKLLDIMASAKRYKCVY